MAKIYGGRWQLVDGRNSGGAGRHEFSRQGLIGRAFAGICAQKNDAAAGRSGRVVGAPKRGSGEQDWTAQVASRAAPAPSSLSASLNSEAKSSPEGTSYS